MEQKVVLVSKDVLGCFALPAYGNIYCKTPNIDELAAKGTVFERHYTAAPSTAMSYIAMFGGIYPYQTGIRDYRPLEADKVFCKNLFDELTKEGYDCHILWEAEWDDGFKNYCNVWGSATFHWLEGMGQHVGGKFPHEGRLLPDESKEQKLLDNFEKIFYEMINTQNKTFTWIHFPHVLSGRTGYGNDMDLFDACIGVIRKYISDSAIYITADHGHMNGMKGKIGYGFDVYESAVRIPLITPRIDGLSTYKDITSNIDLGEIICNQKITKRDFVLSDCAYYAQPKRKLAIIGSRYKYIFNKENATEEFYDVLFDPNENMNIVNMNFLDIDRNVTHPLEEMYFYPFWEESREMLEKYRHEKEAVWKEVALKEKIYYKMRHILGKDC